MSCENGKPIEVDLTDKPLEGLIHNRRIVETNELSEMRIIPFLLLAVRSSPDSIPAIYIAAFIFKLAYILLQSLRSVGTRTKNTLKPC